MVKLASEQIEFMLAKLQIPPGLRAKLEAAQKGAATLTLQDADQLRDLCGDRLQTHGFGENYELTSEGAVLEELIDRLFTG